MPAVGAEVEPRSRGELRDGDEAIRLPRFDAVWVVHLGIQPLAGGEAAKPPLVRRNLSERALFRDWRSALLRVEVGDGRHLANEREAGRTVVPKVVAVDHPKVDMLGPGAVDAPELDAVPLSSIIAIGSSFLRSAAAM